AVSGGTVNVGSVFNGTVGHLNASSGGTVNLTGGSLNVSGYAAGNTSVPSQAAVDGTVNVNGGTWGLGGPGGVLLTGGGTLNLSGNRTNFATFNGPSTIATGITIRGQHGYVGANSAGTSVTNKGTIQADTSDVINSRNNGGITVRFSGNPGWGDYG